ncbi:hypothetical protein HDG34_002503 [Paraburkholderia sp. HC6.4b]|nr:hypothetical protein [Paraburkholderia sp. HC6.4b]MBB5450398.1 hypothetical protein [Paraburkholderia sp. Kb1A]
MSSRSRKRRAKLRPPDVGDGLDTATVDRYEPDYAQSCEACGEGPTVTGLRDGAVVLDTCLCGPCCFGDARMVDPCTWNG